MKSLWMMVAAALFAIMGACVKLAAARYQIAEIVFYRAATGVVTLGAYAVFTGRPLGTPVPWIHFRRGAVGTAALALWFFSLSVLPLGTATALSYTSSLFLAAIVIVTALRAGRPIDRMLLATVLLGFGGVLLVLRPRLDAGQWPGALAGLLCGLLSATAFGFVRDLARRGEPEWRIVFYFSVAALVLGLGASLATGLSAHTPVGVALLASVGITAMLAQLAMTRAYSTGQALATASLQYSAIVFAAVIGMVVFDDRITTMGAAGMVIVIVSGALAGRLAQRRPRTDTETAPAAVRR